MRTVIAATALFLLTACSSGAADEAPKAAETTEAAPKVSTATTCGQLFDGDEPAQQIVDLMTADHASPGTARTLADDLDDIGAQAGDDLEPHITVVSRELREYADSVGETFDTGDLVTSLTDLNNVCGVTPRFN